MRAGLKAVVVLVLAGLFMGGLTLVAPAAPLRPAQAAEPVVDRTVRTDIVTDISTRITDLTTVTDITTRVTDLTTRITDRTTRLLTGTINVTVKGPGKINNCGPDDGVSTEKLCSFSGILDGAATLTAALQSDANTQARFTGWTGACSGTALSCALTYASGTQSVTATFVDDHKPTVTLNTPAQDQLVITAPTGKLAPDVLINETGLTATCQVDSGTPVSCNDVTVPNAPGDPTARTLKVNVNDRWGNASNTVTRAFRSYVTQDTVINDGPADGAAINTSTVSFAFAATKQAATATFTCTLGSVTDSDCPSGKRWNLDDGDYTFSVTSKVPVEGQTATDSTPAVRHFTVDTKAPETTIDAGPADGLLTNVRTGVFAFSSNEQDVRFECSLNGAPFDACPGGKSGQASYDDVGVGRMSLAVRAVDRAGNADPVPASRAWTVTADLDGDGFTLPGDCDDSNPAIHPGAVEILDNGVDENCNGVAELNLDRDGDSFPRPQDCNDANAAIHPGAAEIVGNAVDENCDRIVEPFPTLPSSVGYVWVPKGKATVLKSFFIRNAQPGSTIHVACKGRCAVKAQTQAVKKAAKVLDLTKLVKGRKLKPGTMLEITVTKPQTIGSYTSLTMRKAGGPQKVERCLPPGAKSPQTC
jgi:hypothetical protein